MTYVSIILTYVSVIKTPYARCYVWIIGANLVLLSLLSLLLSLLVLLLLLLLVVVVVVVVVVEVLQLVKPHMQGAHLQGRYPSWYTESPLQDSRLFGPSTWNILAATCENRFPSNPAPGENARCSPAGPTPIERTYTL